MIDSRFDRSDFELYQRYIKDTTRYQLLNRQDELELVERAQSGNEKARERLICSNLRFVVNVAFNYTGQGLPLPDLINEGNIGLINAISKFDLNRNVKFISFAVWWIRQAIVQAIIDRGKLIRTSAHHARRLRKISSLNQNLKQTIGGQYIFNENEIIKKTGFKKPDLKKTLEANFNFVSGNALIQEGASESFFDLIKDNRAEPPDQISEYKNLVKVMDDTLEELTPREQKILRLYYGLAGNPGLSLGEISLHFNLTKERIRQIKKTALEKLRNLSINRVYLQAA